MQKEEDREERFISFSKALELLPTPHYETIKYLMSHLNKVSQHSNENLMSPGNLAVV